jgi:ribosomal protein L16 Arg81 hydroxylase
MDFQQLLGELPVQSFFEEHYLKLPLAMRDTATGCAPLGDWQMLIALLAEAHADLMIASRQGRWTGARPRSADDARKLLDAGYTIGIRHVQQLNERLTELAREFEAVFSAPVDIHFYVTPAGCGGFGWHYDAEEVFVLQTAGSKAWSLRKNTVNPWPLMETLPEDMRYGREIMPLLRCQLEAGDWLYIPGGYWHTTEAGLESYSLSLGIAAQTGIDILDFARRELLDSLRWRQRIGPRGCGTEVTTLHDVLAAHFADLGTDFSRLLNDPRFVARFLEWTRKDCAP